MVRVELGGADVDVDVRSDVDVDVSSVVASDVERQSADPWAAMLGGSDEEPAEAGVEAEVEVEVEIETIGDEDSESADVADDAANDIAVNEPSIPSGFTPYQDAFGPVEGLADGGELTAAVVVTEDDGQPEPAAAIPAVPSTVHSYDGMADDAADSTPPAGPSEPTAAPPNPQDRESAHRSKLKDAESAFMEASYELVELEAKLADLKESIKSKKKEVTGLGLRVQKLRAGEDEQLDLFDGTCCNEPLAPTSCTVTVGGFDVECSAQASAEQLTTNGQQTADGGLVTIDNDSPTNEQPARRRGRPKKEPAAPPSLPPGAAEDDRWRSVSTRELNLEAIKGIGKKTLGIIYDRCPTIGDLEDLRADFYAGGLTQIDAIGPEKAGDIENAILDWLAKYRDRAVLERAASQAASAASPAGRSEVDPSSDLPADEPDHDSEPDGSEPDDDHDSEPDAYEAAAVAGEAEEIAEFEPGRDLEDREDPHVIECLNLRDSLRGRDPAHFAPSVAGRPTWDDGYQAFVEGDGVEACPWVDSEKRGDWIRGWCMAELEDRIERDLEQQRQARSADAEAEMSSSGDGGNSDDHEPAATRRASNGRSAGRSTGAGTGKKRTKRSAGDPADDHVGHHSSDATNGATNGAASRTNSPPAAAEAEA